MTERYGVGDEMFEYVPNVLETVFTVAVGVFWMAFVCLALIGTNCVVRGALG